MWRTPASPHGMPALRIQSEWVSGALRISFAGWADSLAAARVRANTDALQPATHADFRNVRRFMVWWTVNSELASAMTAESGTAGRAAVGAQPLGCRIPELPTVLSKPDASPCRTFLQPKGRAPMWPHAEPS